MASELSAATFRMKVGWAWNDMLPDSQEQVMVLLTRHFRSLFSNVNTIQHETWESLQNCNLELVGSGWGAHQLCTNLIPSDSCSFLSFGIANDHSFDTHLARIWRCRGFAADPTVNHKSKIHPFVSFHNIGAKTLKDGGESYRKPKNWWFASVPSLVRSLELLHVNVIKMDCEGCEYSLSRDIMREDPGFLDKVDQLTIEVHLSRYWLNDTEAFYYFVLLFKLMSDSGLSLAGLKVGSCSPEHESYGWMKEVNKLYNFHWNNFNQSQGRSCHEYLFARI